MDSMERIYRLIRQDDQGCWIWIGATMRGQPTLHMRPANRMRPAKRMAYEWFNEVTVPATHVVASRCKQPLCVNPAHHTAVLRGQQSHKKFGMSNPPAYCQRGHEFSPWNTGRQRNGGRLCLLCDRNNRQKNAARNRAEHPERERATRQARHKAKREFLVSLKISCCRCGENHPACLDFHHRDPATKDVNISQVAGNISLKRLREEVQKCEVICSNCHRKLHWDEKHDSAAAVGA